MWRQGVPSRMGGTPPSIQPIPITLLESWSREWLKTVIGIGLGFAFQKRIEWKGKTLTDWRSMRPSSHDQASSNLYQSLHG